MCLSCLRRGNACPSEPGERRRQLKKTTEVMHVELGWAVIELRRRLEWSQTELARAIDKQGQNRRATDYMTIGRWERGIDSPSPAKRMALAKISTKRGHEDLAKRFPRASHRVALGCRAEDGACKGILRLGDATSTGWTGTGVGSRGSWNGVSRDLSGSG
jgi:transcriptional regulator with XRE-family HTH domain